MSDPRLPFLALGPCTFDSGPSGSAGLLRSLCVLCGLYVCSLQWGMGVAHTRAWQAGRRLARPCSACTRTCWRAARAQERAQSLTVALMLLMRPGRMRRSDLGKDENKPDRHISLLSDDTSDGADRSGPVGQAEEREEREETLGAPPREDGGTAEKMSALGEATSVTWQQIEQDSS